MHDIVTSTQIAIHGSIALFGALVHALDSHRKGISKTFMDFCILLIMSSFSGVMFALIGVQFFPDQIYLTTAFAGTGGYLGVEGMGLIVAIVKSKLK